MNGDCLLRTVLGANAVFSATTGIAMAAFPLWVGSVIGLESIFLLTIVGIGLILYSAYLLVLSRGGMPTILSLFATFGDLTWTLGTILMVSIAPNLFSRTGWAIAFLVAIIVFFFAVLQLFGIRQRFLSRTSKWSEKYHICFAIPVEVSEGAIWNAVRDVGSIHRFAPSIVSSEVTATTHYECTKRTCTDNKNRRWTEQIQIDEEQKQLIIHFDTSATDFPFPTTSMSGGWRIYQALDSNQSMVLVWWNFSFKHDWAAAVLLPLFELGLKSQISTVVTNMAAAISPQQKLTRASLLSKSAIGGC